MIVEDNVISFPALLTAGRAVRPDRVLQPAGDAGPGLPPVFSGYPVGHAMLFTSSCTMLS